MDLHPGYAVPPVPNQHGILVDDRRQIHVVTLREPERKEIPALMLALVATTVCAGPSSPGSYRCMRPLGNTRTMCLRQASLQ